MARRGSVLVVVASLVAWVPWLWGCGGGGGGGTPNAQPAAPVITSFAAARSPITRGTATALTAVFASGTGTVDHGVGAVTSGAAVSTGNLLSDTAFRLTVTGPGGTVTRDVTVNVVDAALQPAITAPASAETGTTGLAASVPAQAGATFAWTITGGTFTGGGTTASGKDVTFTAGGVGALTLTCTATNLAGDASTPGTTTVTVVAAGAPVITSFTAAKSPLTTGSATTLTAVFAGGTGTVDHGIGAVVSGSPLSTGPLTARTTYTLTVTGPGGTTTASVTVEVVAAALQPAITAPASATAGTAGLSASVPDQAGVTFSWTITGGTFTGGGTTATGTGVTFTAGGAGTVALTCTATNAAGDASAAGTASVTVVAAPDATITAALPKAPYVTAGQFYDLSVPAQAGMTYAWSILDGNPSGTSFSGSTSANAVAIHVGETTGTLKLQAVVTNGLGATATKTIGLWAVPRPWPTGFELLPPVVTSGGSSTLTATFASGNGETALLYRGLGTPGSPLHVSSGTLVGLGTLASPTALTLAVTNLAGTTYPWQRTVSVAGQPGSMPIDPLLQPRWCHAVIPLANGRYLVAGGAWTDPRAELFDPVTSTFSYTGAMSAARLCPSTTLLANGKVLVAGGWSSTGPNPDGTAELYDPATGQFTATGALKGGRQKQAAVRLDDGKVLLAGGSYRDAPLATAELYDPATGQFTAVGSMTVTSGENITAIKLASGKVLVLGAGANQAELYDPSTKTFGNVIALQGYRWGGVRLADGRVLFPGGAHLTGPEQGTLSDTAEIYDPGTGSATLLDARLDHPRIAGCVLLPDGRVAVVSGYSDLALDTAVELFDPATGLFTLAGGLQWGHSSETGFAVLPDGRILVAGGQFRFGDTDTNPEWLKLFGAFAEIYDPSGATVTVPHVSADLAGEWEMNDLASGPGAPWWMRGRLTVAGDGGFAGTLTASDGWSEAATGTFHLSSTGVVTASVNPTHGGFLDSGGTVMAGVSTWTSGSPGTTEMGVVVKMGDSYSTAELTGTWESNSLASGPGAPRWERGQATFLADGTYISTTVDSAGVTDTKTSTTALSSSGVMTIAAAPTFRGVVDAGRTVVVSTDTMPDGTTELRVGVKIGSSYGLPDLAGTWTGVILASGPGAPYWGRGRITVAPDGTFSGTTTDHLGFGGTTSGRFAISSGGVVTLDGKTARLVMDAGKTVMVGSDTWTSGSPGTTELMVFTKVR